MEPMTEHRGGVRAAPVSQGNNVCPWSVVSCQLSVVRKRFDDLKLALTTTDYGQLTTDFS